MNQSDFLYQNRNTIAAGVASFCSTVAGSPLDSIKARLQTKSYASVYDCIRTTFRDEGVRGFFRGVTIPLVTITAVRTASFTIYTGTKSQLSQRNLLDSSTFHGTALMGFGGGAVSGVALSFGTSMFEFGKIKQQLEYSISVQRNIPYEPTGAIQTFRQLYSRGGVRMLYTGFRLHAIRDTLGTGLYFCFYDSARYALDPSSNILPFTAPKYVSTFVCGSGAGMASWLLIYPLDLVKSKVQRNALAESPYERPWSIFKRVSGRGITKLYRGLGVSAVRSLVSHGLMWTVLEAVRSSIEKRSIPWIEEAGERI